MPVRMISNPGEEEVIEFTTGRKSSSFRIIIPMEIVKLMGLSTQMEEKFLVIYNPKNPNSLTIKRLTKEDLKRLLRG